MLSTAMVDALGGPSEFQGRFSFPFVTDMGPNTNFPGYELPPGVWTDDTSMTLCLAASLSGFSDGTQTKEDRNANGRFDEIHQLTLYSRWKDEGYLSSIDKCFDIGDTTKFALIDFKRQSDAGVDREAILDHLKKTFSKDAYSGNGSLMRVLPVGLAYWRNEEQAKTLARRSSLTTHPNSICQEVCEVWTGAITLILKNTTNGTIATTGPEVKISKLDVLAYFAHFPYTTYKLANALGIPHGIPPASTNLTEREAWYFQYHPILKLIKETQGPNAEAAGSKIVDESFPYYIPSEEKLSSSGFVLHTAVAALYCFFATRTFEEGALMAVNLGRDADTVGAIYAGLAGCWYSYAEGEDIEDSVFWTDKVRSWRDGLIKRNVVEEIAECLVLEEEKMKGASTMSNSAM